MSGILGEGYSDTLRCSSSANIEIIVDTDVALADKEKLTVNAGGLQAAASNVRSSLASGDVTVQVNAPSAATANVGALVGSERYGTIQNSAAHGSITVDGSSVAYVGGIVGKFDSGYGGMGPIWGIKSTEIKNCYSTGDVQINRVGELHRGGISGSGKPEPLKSQWGGGTMSYTLSTPPQKLGAE